MTVRSKDRASWLTKLERIGKLSAQNRQMVFNNIGHLLNADMLKEQFQRLDGNKAIGIDKVTKADYGEKLDENIAALIKKLRRNTYKPKPARITEISKEDGSTRPLAISCLEDKLIQISVSVILEKIYEPLFLSCSYGYRPGKNCHTALKSLNKATYHNPRGSIVDIDVCKYFNTIPHGLMMKLLRKKISDNRFLRLVEILMTAPIIMQGKQEEKNQRGCPQGSCLSPILANIYLHHLVDEWFTSITKTHIKGRAELIRFADDMVFVFERQSDAMRFYNVLPKRLARGELEMHAAKSRVIPTGRIAAKQAFEKGSRLPTFNFLGFTCYWGLARKGFWRLKYTSRKDRFATKLKEIREYLRNNLNTRDTHGVIKAVVRVVKGWVNYHGVSDNKRRVGQFLEKTKRILLWWLNRRGGKHRVTWNKLLQILKVAGFPKHWKTVSMF
jgi:group II intron reverse transcriptase/maturase